MTEHANEDTPGTAEANDHTTGLKIDLYVPWANEARMSATEDFNADQYAVNDWCEASNADQLEALTNSMTLADAEELCATARSVSIEHARRAERARQLVAVVAARLGREAEMLREMETVKAVPVPTKLMSQASLPSAS